MDNRTTGCDTPAASIPSRTSSRAALTQVGTVGGGAMRRVALAALTVAALAGVTACGASNNGGSTSSAGSTGSAAAGKTYTLAIGSPDATGDATVNSLTAFATAVNKDTGGKVTIKIYPNNQLGQDTTQLTAIVRGSQFGYLGGTAEYEPYSKYMDLFDLPYLFNKGDSVIQSALYGSVGTTMDQQLAQAQLTALAWEFTGDRDFFSKTQITDPSQLRGLKVRVPPGNTEASMYSFVGADPEQVATSDLVTSFQSGLVSASDSPLAKIVSTKLYQVAPYISLTHELQTPFLLAVSSKILNSLPASYQAAIKKDAVTAAKAQWQSEVTAEQQYQQTITSNGGHVLTVNLPAWQAALIPFAKKYVASLNVPAITSLYNEIQKDY
jgi:TRAP-type transport system periplasmic protein